MTLESVFMSADIERLRKMMTENEVALLIEEKTLQNLNIQQRQALEKLKARLMDDEGLDEIPPLELLNQVYKPRKSFELRFADQPSAIAIFQDFSTQFGEKYIDDDNKLSFQDLKSADGFFRSQSDKGREFLFQELNTDNYYFSDGTNYINGTKQEVLNFCKMKGIKEPHMPMNDEPVQSETRSSSPGTASN